jgi:hypothetical protein
MGRLTFESMNLSGIPPYCEVEAAPFGPAGSRDACF